MNVHIIHIDHRKKLWSPVMTITFIIPLKIRLFDFLLKQKSARKVRRIEQEEDVHLSLSFLAPKFDPCDSSPCHGYAQCIPNFEQNSYECKCNPGFLGDGVRRCDGKISLISKSAHLTCLFSRKDINECIQSPCHPNAICTNTYGNFTCECKRNYIGNGFVCKPIHDESKEANNRTSSIQKSFPRLSS